MYNSCCAIFAPYELGFLLLLFMNSIERKTTRSLVVQILANNHRCSDIYLVIVSVDASVNNSFFHKPITSFRISLGTFKINAQLSWYPNESNRSSL